MLCILAVLGSSSAFAVPTIPNGQTGPDRLVVGTWRYDVDTLRVELEPRAKQDMISLGKAGTNAYLAKLGDLRRLYRDVALRFDANHRFTMTHGKGIVIATGQWSMRNRSISTAADRKELHLPQLTLDRAGKTIAVVYSNPGLGRTLVTLVPKR